MLNTSFSRCPYGHWEKAARSACNSSDRFHCFEDEFKRIGWLCIDPIWIESGKCPVYNSGVKKLDVIRCNGDNCPTENYRSNNVYKFNGCHLPIYKKEQNSATSAGNGINDTMRMEYYVIIGVAILLLLAVGMLFFFLRRRRHLHRKLPTSVIDEKEDVGLSLLTDTSNDTYSRAASCLASKKFVVLKGTQGSGKTFSAKKLADNINQISKTECQVMWMHDVLGNEMPWLTSKTLLVLDDIFYELQSKDEIQATIMKAEKFFEKASSSKSFYVIVTIPTLLWKRHLDLFKDKRCFDHYVDLDILSKEERTEILNHYLSPSIIKEEGSAKEDELIMREKVKSAIINFESCYSLGYPSCVAWICRIQDQFDLNEAGRFMNFPLTKIRNEIYRLSVSEKFKERKMFLLLAFMTLCGGKLNEKELDEDLLMSLARIFFPNDDCSEYALQEYDQSLFSLKEKYIRKASAGVYEFYLGVVIKLVFVIALERNVEALKENISRDMWKRFAVQREKLPTDLVGEHSHMFIKL